MNGKPVVFIYGRVMKQVKRATADDIEAWKRVRRRLEELDCGFFMIGDSLNPSYAECMDGLHTYNPIGFTTKGVGILPLYRRVSKELKRVGKLFAATVSTVTEL